MTPLAIRLTLLEGKLKRIRLSIAVLERRLSNDARKIQQLAEMGRLDDFLSGSRAKVRQQQLDTVIREMIANWLSQDQPR